MSKMTISGLKSAMSTYVAAAKQAGTWSASNTSFTGLLDKIGKQVTLDGTFNDKLPELEGDPIELGTTVEEYFIDLTLPEAFPALVDGTSVDQDKPARPSVEAVSYSYTLGREKIKTTVPYDDWERACINEAAAGQIGSKIVERLQNSYELTRYAEKKQLIGNAIDKAVTASNYVQLAKPVDESTGEAFIKKIKDFAEDAQFAHMGDCLAGSNALIGASPRLTLYIKKGIMSSLEVDTLAGAFHAENLALPVDVKVIDDFGTMTNSKDVYCVLVDPRGIKLHNHYQATRSHENADGDFVNLVKHFEDTGFISKYVYIKAIGVNA